MLIDNHMESTKLTYQPPEILVVEIQPECALLQTSSSKDNYRDGGDYNWNSNG